MIDLLQSHGCRHRTNQHLGSTGERPDLPADPKSVNERARGRIDGFIKPINKDGNCDYRLTRLSPYWAHQRCAQTYRKGNVLLAGDAAHSNNPIGGLGLTGGILDAVVVGNALTRHLRGGEPDSIVTEAVESRRKTWLGFVNPVSQGNFRRLFATDEAEVADREAFFEQLSTRDEQLLASMESFTNLLPDNFEATCNSNDGDINKNMNQLNQLRL